ncbi:MAG: efflux RND transporter permease subunit [Armatimonadetes bacterium]|nr:efflux RND transporter permease subunit [Armatimonadota bacterium]
MWLTRLAIGRPIVIWMCLAAIAVLGALSYSRLPAELNPKVEIPTLTVVTVYPGAGPAEVESSVTRLIEDAVGSAPGLRDVYSSSQESLSVVSLDLAVGTDLNQAQTMVRERIELARAMLPEGVRPPIVAKLDINAQPVLQVAIPSAGDAGALRRAVDRHLSPRLARIQGVATVEVTGGPQTEVRVLADVPTLTSLGVTLDDVSAALKASNRSVPSGSLLTGTLETAYRTEASFRSLEDVRHAMIPAQRLMAQELMPDLPIPGLPGKDRAASPLTIGDVATVVLACHAGDAASRINGRECVGLTLTKSPDANAMDVVDRARALLAGATTDGSLPDGAAPVVVRDESAVVRRALHDVNVTLVLGALLATLVVLLFLREVRGTVIVALALPACMVATYLMMHIGGFTLNQMTLLALSLSVGILVDDSIVVLESITRHLEAGETPEEAAYSGRTEIGFAGLALTLADVVVFVPIAFMGGVVGAFFREFGITVAFATLFSLLVSFTVTPALAARWYRRRTSEASDSRTGVGSARYKRAVAWALHNRGWVIATGAAALLCAGLVSVPFLGTEFVPATDRGLVSVLLELPAGSSMEATDAVARQVEARLARAPGIAGVATTLGRVLGGFGAIPQQGSHLAQMTLDLQPRASALQRLGLSPAGGPVRILADTDVADRVRGLISDVGGARITVTALRSVANVGSAIQLQLTGDDLHDVAQAAAKARAAVAHLPGILNADTSYRQGKPELQARIDPLRSSATSVLPAMAGSVLRTAIEGDASTTMMLAGASVPIRLRAAGLDGSRPETVADVPVGFSDGTAVMLGDVATIERRSGPVGIDRLNGRRLITVTADLAPGVPLGDAQSRIEAALAGLDLGPVAHRFGGESEAMADNLPYLAGALALAVLLVFAVLASLFNSLLEPLVVMLTLPMALVGALAALVLAGQTLSLVTMVGIMMLCGLMGRNAILLVDYTNTLRQRGMARNEAVAEAGAARLRPILMTTITTLVGMAPVALSLGDAAELRAPMATVVIGGLTVSTVLTLLVVPAVYTVADDLRSRLARRGNGATR